MSEIWHEQRMFIGGRLMPATSVARQTLDETAGFDEYPEIEPLAERAS